MGGMADPPRRRPSLWILGLAVVGAIALASVALTLFTAVGRRPPRTFTTAPLPVGSPEFLATVVGATAAPVHDGGTVELLHNGAFYDAFEAAARAATRSITFGVYIWEPGQASERLIAVLTERARAGVAVRVLLDGWGSLNMAEADERRLRAAGVKVARFAAPRFGKLTRQHKRNHRRAIVVDGRIGFTGGVAVADKWLGDAQDEHHWRDMMVKVTGPMAASLQAAFVGPWAHTTGELLAGPDFFPLPPGPAEGGTGLRHVGVASAPGSEDHPLRLLFLQTFASVRRHLYVTTPYLVPERSLLEALGERARAGVDVRILVPDGHNDVKPVRWASQTLYGELLAAGVQIYEYQGTMMHAKALTADGDWSVFGSVNLDIRGMEFDRDVALGIQDAAFARALEEAFAADLRRSRPVTLEEWRRRGWLARLRGRGAGLFHQFY